MSCNDATTLTKRSASSALMPPPPAPKRIKRPAVVLDEDTYVSAVSHIIRRDFFPGLAEADAQREYLNAVESKDKSWIREAGKKLTQVMTPVPNGQRRTAESTNSTKSGTNSNSTPNAKSTGTPTRLATLQPEQDDQNLGKLDHVDLNMSLGGFQAKYTSEDQESFSQIVDRQNKKRFDNNAWLRQGNMYASKQRIAQQKVIEARAMKGSSQELIVTSRPSQDLGQRPAAPDGHKHTAFNTLMFSPDGVESWAPTRAQIAEKESLAPPKQVLYSNTRLPALESEPPRPTSPTLSAVRDAVAGRPRHNPSEAGSIGSETPRVNGYAFVDTHVPEPDDDDAPTDLLERYGIDSSTKATPFTIKESSAREKMHHKMVDQINAKRSDADSSSAPRKPTGSGLGIFTSDTPRFLSAPTPRVGALQGGQTPGTRLRGDLTPAAQRLYERMGSGTPKNGGAGGFGVAHGNLKDWTPLPKLRKKA